MIRKQPFNPFHGQRWLAATIALLILLALLLPGNTTVSQAAPGLSFAAAQAGQPISLETRFACQTAIEEVYWQNRIWPAENPNPKPPLAAVLPASAIEAKVLNSLAQSQALTDYWQQPLTPAMLQAEMERQANQTRQPEVLAAVWAALDNNPALVAECLARPALANRLLHNWFEQDQQVAGQTYSAWWEASKNDFAFDINQPIGSYQLPTLNRNPLQDDTWQSTAAIPGQTLGQGVWTGTEMLFLGNRSTQGFRYNPTTDDWDTMTTVGAPQGVNDYTAVWTGTEMITWGGCNGTHEFCTTSMGGRYNPATDTWTLTNMTGAPGPRRKHGAVWTGSEMIVWGGCTESSSGNQNCIIVLNNGGRYNPATNSWQAVTTTNAPAARIFPPLVWTDDEMILWSGSAASSPGGRYNPTTNTWQSISATNGPAGNNSTLIWTGSEVIAWGGCTGTPFCTTYYNTGGRYNPNSNSWTPTNTTGAPSARSEHKAVWTGSAMLVWGGYNGSSYLATGGRYDPATNSWTAIGTTNAPAARGQHQAFWTGIEMLVWGGWGNNGAARNGARYNPASNSWTPIDATDPYSFREHHTAIWTGTEMIAWGGYGDGTAATGLDTGRIYDPITDSWDETSVSNAPSPRAGHSAIWTGTEMIVWGGNTLSWPTPGDGGRYNPMSDSWSATSTAGAPQAPTYHSAVWTGTEMIVFGGSTYNLPWDNKGGRYNPNSNSWSAISTAGVPQGRYLHTAVWTGSQMLIWGGAGSTGSLGDGARYTPATNTWSTISTTNDPSPRVLHTAIWDGSRMIIWGGSEDYSPWVNTNTGGLYDPSTNSWTATSTANAPSARAKHTAVWTGEEMIVWSGCTSNDMSCLMGDANGGRYDPQANSWTATSTVHAPEARQWHSAVWTGTEMIVWAGTTDDNGYTNTGGRYHVVTAGNQAPLANNDTYQGQANTPLPVAVPGVLGNDSDPDSDPLSAVLVSNPGHGTLALQANGSFLYTPATGFSGADSFTYQASDGTNVSNVAVVAINVQGITPTPTATPISGGSTGYRSPAAHQLTAGGDNNGYESSPANAYSDNSLFALDSDSGTGTGTGCNSTGKDRQRYYNYGFPLPAGSTITGLAVRLDAKVDSTAGAPKLCVQLSWNGGSSWTTPKATTTLGTAEGVYILGGAADSWGRVWTAAELSNASFRLRITNVSSDLNRDFSLDWVAVNVHYSTGPTATPTASPMPSPTATPGSGSDTGLVSPQANAVAGGGDRNGFQSSPANAHQDDGLLAADVDSGNNDSTSCTDAGKDKHRFYTFPFNLPAGALVTGIQVRLDALADNAANNPQMCVQLSWDGGASWTAAQVTPVLGTTETTYLLGGPGNTWGRSWSAAELNNGSFQVRITNVAAATTRDFYLDWVAVRVYYQ